MWITDSDKFNPPINLNNIVTVKPFTASDSKKPYGIYFHTPMVTAEWFFEDSDRRNQVMSDIWDLTTDCNPMWKSLVHNRE